MRLIWGDEERNLVGAYERMSVLEDTLEESENERRRLLDIIVGMKRDGFQPPVALPEKGPSEELDSRLIRAVEAKARPGESLYGELMTHADALLRSGMDVEDVIKDINRGGAYPEEDE